MLAQQTFNTSLYLEAKLSCLLSAGYSYTLFPPVNWLHSLLIPAHFPWQLEPDELIIRQKFWLTIAALLIVGLLIVSILALNLYRKVSHNERHLREVNQRILAVVDYTDSIILSLDSDSTIRLLSKSASRFFKRWVNIELKAGDKLLPKLKNTAAYQHIMEWQKRSQELKGWKEVSQVKVGERELYLLESFSSIRKPDGSYAGLVLVANDITVEHEYNVKLTEQRDFLQRSDHAKQRMLSILAHDLKDAIYSAHSVSGLVQESPDNFDKEELHHLFKLLHDNFEKTKNLLEGLLEWMKTQSKDMTPSLSTFNLHDTALTVTKAFEEKLANKNIKLRFDVPENTLVNADREMVKTVLRNLLSNAIKYTRSDEGEIRIYSENLEDKATIHVQDNGEGISDQNRHKLFKNPGEFSTMGTENEHGTGFGLSLCYELLQLHQTKLSLKSSPGAGSDFYFELPLSIKTKSTIK